MPTSDPNPLLATTFRLVETARLGLYHQQSANYKVDIKQLANAERAVPDTYDQEFNRIAQQVFPAPIALGLQARAIARLRVWCDAHGMDLSESDQPGHLLLRYGPPKNHYREPDVIVPIIDRIRQTVERGRAAGVLRRVPNVLYLGNEAWNELCQTEAMRQARVNASMYPRTATIPETWEGMEIRVAGNRNGVAVAFEEPAVPVNS